VVKSGEIFDKQHDTPQRAYDDKRVNGSCQQDKHEREGNEEAVSER